MPEAPVDEPVALPDAARGGDDGHRGAYSTSERPVRRRKTSSRLDRRTSARLDRDLALVDLLERVLAVGGVEQQPIRQLLDPIGQAVELAVEVGADGIGDAQLEHLPRGVLVDQLPRRALGHDLRLVHDDEVVAQLLRLVHVVGRDDQRRPAPLQLVEALPQQVPRLRVEAGRRLVQDDQLRLVDERAGDRQAPLHAAGQRLDLVLGALVELDELEQLVGALAGDVAGDVEVARVHLEVLAHRQLGVEVVDLRHHAQLRLDLARLGARIHADHAELALGDRAGARDHPHRARLARPVRPQEPERPARMHVEVDAVDREEAVRA